MSAHLGDFLSPELMHLLDTARSMIDQHIDHHGDCVACGAPWPCRQALLAESALGSL